MICRSGKILTLTRPTARNKTTLTIYDIDLDDGIPDEEIDAVNKID